MQSEVHPCLILIGVCMGTEDLLTGGLIALQDTLGDTPHENCIGVVIESDSFPFSDLSSLFLKLATSPFRSSDIDSCREMSTTDQSIQILVAGEMDGYPQLTSI